MGCALALSVLLLILVAKGTFNSTTVAKRLIGNPIIRPEMLPLKENVNGPSLIRVPSWVSNPKAKFYLYFSSHSSRVIQLAYSENLSGPWNVLTNGTLQLKEALACKGHIASPDVIVDDDRKEIRLYFHCPSRAMEGQKTFIARSSDGIRFKASSEVLGIFYWRVFQYKTMWYAMAKGGLLYRSQTGLGSFEEGPNPFPGGEMRDRDANNPGPRHVAIQGPFDDRLLVYYTNIGDAPERILRTSISLNDDWKSWKTTEPIEILRPSEKWEGFDLPVVKSSSGEAKSLEHAIRDPAIFVDHDNQKKRVYLLYSVAGEAGIAIAEIFE